MTKCKVQLLIICQPSGSKENRGGIVSPVCRPHLTPHLPPTNRVVSIWLLKATTYAITGGAAEGGRLKAETKGSAATTTPYTTQQHTYLDTTTLPRGHNNNGISGKTNQQTNKQNLKNDVRNATRTDSNVERRIVKEIFIIRMKETCQPTLQTNDEYNRCHPGPPLVDTHEIGHRREQITTGTRVDCA